MKLSGIIIPHKMQSTEDVIVKIAYFISFHLRFCFLSFILLFSLRLMVLRNPLWPRCRGQSSVGLESF